MSLLLVSVPVAGTATPADSPPSESPAPLVEEPGASEAGGEGAPEPAPAPRRFASLTPWWDRLKEIRSLPPGSESRREADAMWGSLSGELARRREALVEGLDRGIEIDEPVPGWVDAEGSVMSLEQVFEKTEDAYQMRAELLREISPELERSVRGTGLRGVEEFIGELKAIGAYLEYQWRSIPYGLRKWRGQIRRAPLPLAWSLLWALVAIWLFGLWRRLVPPELERLRQSLLRASPPRTTYQRWATAIWYFEQIRRPLEWLVLASVLFSCFELPEVPEPERIAWLLVRWGLWTWLVVSLTGSVIRRRARYPEWLTGTPLVASLRWVGAWLVVSVAALDLASRYSGRGTVFAWTVLACKLLAVPIAAWLLLLWRPWIFSRLEREALWSGWAPELLRHRRGPRSLVSAALALGLVVAGALLRGLLRQVARFEGGRRLLAALVQREVLRRTHLLATRERLRGEPLPPETVERLLSVPKGSWSSAVAAAELQTLLERIGSRRVVAVVVGERGLGRSAFLDRLRVEASVRSLLVACPESGWPGLEARLAEELGCAPGDLREGLDRATREGLELICVDDIHRLSRPTIDGLVGLERLIELARAFPDRCSWVATIDALAWLYVEQVRAGNVDLAVRLPRWTEDQIGALIEERNEEVGLDPEFSHLELLRRLDETHYSTPEERSRYGFYRYLWLTADGNPSIALRLWSRSLQVAPDGTVLVLAPPLPPVAELADAPWSIQCLLRFLAMTELSTSTELLEGLGLAEHEVRFALSTCLARQWVEESGGYYRLTWNSYRPVVDGLTRRNLLGESSALGGGEPRLQGAEG